MAPSMREKVEARNRRQREHALELRRDARLHQYLTRARAERKIQRSRARLGRQVSRSRETAMGARRKAIRAQERAQQRQRWR